MLHRGVLRGVVLVVGAGVAHPAERATRVLPRVGEVGVLGAVPAYLSQKPPTVVHAVACTANDRDQKWSGLPPTECVPRAGDGRAGCGSSSASRSVGSQSRAVTGR